MTDGLAAIATETYEIEKQDSLANEIDAFLDCVMTGTKPLVDGRAGCEALRVASMINREHRGASQEGARRRAVSRSAALTPTQARRISDDVEHDLGGALARRGTRSPSAFTTSLKALPLLGADLLRAENVADRLGRSSGRALFLKALRHHLASDEQVHQRCMLDGDPHAADQKGGGRADAVGDHHRHIGERKLERHGARFGHGGIGGGKCVEAFGHVDDEDRVRGQFRVMSRTTWATESTTGMTM